MRSTLLMIFRKFKIIWNNSGNLGFFEFGSEFQEKK